MAPRTAMGAARIQRALSEIYAVLNGEARWEEALAASAQATGSELLALLTMGPDAHFALETHPYIPEPLIQYAETYAELDLRPARMALRSGAYMEEDLLSREERARCPIHNEYYREIPACWHIAYHGCRARRGQVISIAHRGAVWRPFEWRETQALAILAPHLARAAELRREAGNADAPRDLMALLNALPDGLIVFDEAGRATHLNLAAAAILASDDALTLGKGQLKARDPAVRPFFTAAMARTLRVARAMSEGKGQGKGPGETNGEDWSLPSPVLLPREGSPWPVLARFFVAPRPGRRPFGLVKLEDVGESTLPAPAEIAALARLTPAEARIARRLLLGFGPAEAAEAEGLSEHTVRTHVRALRSKLGTTSQAGIVSRLSRLVAA